MANAAAGARGLLVRALRVGSVVLLGAVAASAATDPAAVVPAQGPRTLVLTGQHDAFRAYCTTGPGAEAFARIKQDLDTQFLSAPFPAEPITYGDPEPRKRTSDMADLWRAQQDTCGFIGGLAEAATLCWIVTGEEKYFAKAREFLLASCEWSFAPKWQSGPVPGASDIYYNDEAHFRLWRKLPLVYDQLRHRLTEAERATILAHFKERGNRSVRWLREAGIEKVVRNSLAGNAPSHPIRFMAMTGLTALALWDDLPDTRDWWQLAYVFYRDQFSPWGGDDGGWAEGPPYWRGTFEHAAFQDALLAIGDPAAYSSSFWRNSPYFAVYNVQPYRHTVFGDASNAGHFNLEPVIADFMEHMARVLGDGRLLAYASLLTDTRERPLDRGLGSLDRTYPTAAEFLLRNFVASSRPLPAPAPLDSLPGSRHFADIGWVAMHSALGRPDEDIHLTFKSSAYGSYSHSHADQNAFILNAYGEGLAINSAYREYHNSPHHDQWTRQTISKNALLIDGVGQKAKSKDSTGKIIRYKTGDRVVWTTGDATVAYAKEQKDQKRIRRVTRDVVFVDQRYFILRDRVELGTAGRLSWLLHAPTEIRWDAATSTAFVPGQRASLTAAVLTTGRDWTGTVTTDFTVPVDAKYVTGLAGASWVTGSWDDQAHFTLTSSAPATSFTVWTVLWPERTNAAPASVKASVEKDMLVVSRPDGRVDRVKLTDSSLALQ